LDQWAAHYIEYRTGITPGTRVDYTRIYGRTWQPLLGHLPIDVLTRADVARSINVLSDRYGDKIVCNTHGLLAAIMTEAIDSGLISTSPCHGIRLPRRTSLPRCLAGAASAAVSDRLRSHRGRSRSTTFSAACPYQGSHDAALGP
jgi:hypothetical protein